jgi:hypothetical protein
MPDQNIKVEFAQFELAKLDLNQGDTLVIRVKTKLSPLMEERIKRQLDGFLQLTKRGIKSLILPEGMDIDVIKAQEDSHG